MADEDINPVVLLADPKVNHRVWAACLKWSPVVKKQRVPFSSETQAPCKIQTAYLSESDCRQQKFPWEDQPHYRHRNTGQAGAQSLFFPCSGFLLMGEKWIRRLPVQR
ncbi:PilO protein [Escherichia coli]|nr:PilO protein [Escherichia coli]